MTVYIILTSLILAGLLIMAARHAIQAKRQTDSTLKRRAIFSLNEQLTYTRLKEILPTHTVLTHVSFDALLTTKLPRTRNKYRNMVADFVVLDDAYQVLAVITLDDTLTLKRQHIQYQNELLRMAGYTVISFDQVPEYQQLREEFGLLESTENLEALDLPKKKLAFYPASARRMGALG
ncbi:DUF2726 domain-containing protein [Acinetobacter indicus]|uniref:DUF2726 domain-containing protein n=1 Tax=Acinetobacter indicus TaxID=756892 RepID=UPI003F4A3F1B